LKSQAKLSRRLYVINSQGKHPAFLALERNHDKTLKLLLAEDIRRINQTNHKEEMLSTLLRKHMPDIFHWFLLKEIQV
jgi:hypothetical protein